jgi:hypothetical protein
MSGPNPNPAYNLKTHRLEIAPLALETSHFPQHGSSLDFPSYRSSSGYTGRVVSTEILPRAMAAIVLPVSIVGLIFGGCCSNVRRRRTTSDWE